MPSPDTSTPTIYGWCGRVLHAGQSQNLPRYTVSADVQGVTDSQTKLIWRRCVEGMVFSGGSCTGTAITFTHEAALRQAADQASITGVAWRLPNIKELSSIADKSLSNPAIDSTVFPATPSGWFKSSSPNVGSSLSAWNVDFSSGMVFNSSYRYDSGYVRLVRTAP